MSNAMPALRERHYVIDLTSGRPVLAPRTLVYVFGDRRIISTRALNARMLARIELPQGDQVLTGDPLVPHAARRVWFEEGRLRVVLHLVGERATEAGTPTLSPQMLLAQATLATGATVTIDNQPPAWDERWGRWGGLAGALAIALISFGLGVGITHWRSGGTPPAPPSEAPLVPSTVVTIDAGSSGSSPAASDAGAPGVAAATTRWQMMRWNDWHHLPHPGVERYCNRYGDLMAIGPSGELTLVLCGVGSGDAVCVAGQCVQSERKTLSRLPARLCSREGQELSRVPASTRKAPFYRSTSKPCPAAFYRGL